MHNQPQVAGMKNDSPWGQKKQMTPNGGTSFPMPKQVNTQELENGMENMMRPYDLVIPDKTVDKIMGPDPVPMISIEMEEIQNDL